jgi:hypothetical protein
MKIFANIKLNATCGSLVMERWEFFFIWFVRLLALRPLLAYCASLG